MVHDRGQQFGPHTESELATLVAVGTISPNAMIWRTGSPRWIPVSNIVPLPSYLPPPPPTYQHTPNSGNRIAAGVCGILLGGFGVHKFILGFTTAGLIMLLVCLFGSICYGLGWLVMSIIGLIEGIIYLSKSEAQFYQDYVVNKRQWF